MFNTQGARCQLVRSNVRPDGDFHVDMVFGDGAHVAPMRARYDVIEPPNRLSWTETGNGMHTVLEPSDLGDGTTGVITTLVDVPAGFMDPEGRRGFETSLDRMVNYRRRVGCDSTWAPTANHYDAPARDLA